MACGACQLAACVGFPGIQSHPGSKAANIIANAHRTGACSSRAAKPRQRASHFVLRLVLRFHAKSLGDRPALLRFHLGGLEDDVSANHSEGDLAENEPWPIDAYGKFGINDAQRGNDQRRSKSRESRCRPTAIRSGPATWEGAPHKEGPRGWRWRYGRSCRQPGRKD